MADPIEDALDALEALFADASPSVLVSAFNPNERRDHVQCYWTGVTDRRIAYRVDVIPEDWRTMGDLFTRCWNLVADSDQFTPVSPSVNYNASPLGWSLPGGETNIISFASFEAVSGEIIDARGL